MRNTDDAQTIGPFPTETEGLPEAARPEVVELSDGDEFSLEISLVTGVQQPSVGGCSSPQGHPKARFTPVIEQGAPIVSYRR